MEETFSVTEDRFGEFVNVDLKPGGSDIPVTEENKHEYVDLAVHYRIIGRVKEQFDSFIDGFYEVIPKGLITVFDERELELLIGGMTDIDMCVPSALNFSSPTDIFSRDDWSKFTDYRGYDKEDQVISWFWQILRSWPPEQKARLLQFTTGTSRIPVNGFKDLQGSDGPRRFTIEKYGDASKLPRSHTCFNRLDLPPYEDIKTLEDKLRLAIEYVTVAFPLGMLSDISAEKQKDLDKSKRGTENLHFDSEDRPLLLLHLCCIAFSLLYRIHDITKPFSPLLH